MKIQIIHLSDIHLCEAKQIEEINIEAMANAISSEDAEHRLIVISGDLTYSGSESEFDLVETFINSLKVKIDDIMHKEHDTDILFIPGNHDIDFKHFESDPSEIVNTQRPATINLNQYTSLYLHSMDSFYCFCEKYNLFKDDQLIFKKILNFGSKSIGFVLLNTAPFSLNDGKDEDIGKHHISDNVLCSIEDATAADINVLVMHHSYSYFDYNTKIKLRDIIAKKYSLVLSGHEHSPYGEGININDYGLLSCIQGNALHGYSDVGNGFISIILDLDHLKINANSYIKSLGANTYYPKSVISENPIRMTPKNPLYFIPQFSHVLETDEEGRNIAQFYVFPGIKYKTYSKSHVLKEESIDDESSFIDLISKYHTIKITGGDHYGKTTLAKRVFLQLSNMDFTPLLIDFNDDQPKKINAIIRNAFVDEYRDSDATFEVFKQLPKEKKIVIIDNADKIKKQRYFSTNSC